MTGSNARLKYNNARPMPPGPCRPLNSVLLLQKEKAQSFRERLQSIQDVLLQVQDAMDQVASTCERVKK